MFRSGSKAPFWEEDSKIFKIVNHFLPFFQRCPNISWKCNFSHFLQFSEGKIPPTPKYTTSYATSLIVTQVWHYVLPFEQMKTVSFFLVINFYAYLIIARIVYFKYNNTGVNCYTERRKKSWNRWNISPCDMTLLADSSLFQQNIMENFHW